MAFPAVTADVVARYDVAAPRYTSYPTAPSFTESFSADDYAARLDAAAHEGEGSPLSLYVHVPFCRELCTFCGCNVVVARDPAKADPYLDRVIAEAALAARRLGARHRFAQLHWGGGTPTFLDAPRLARLWNGLRRHFVPTDDAEIAIEVDPVVTTRAQLALLRGLGFNRLSLGVQDLDPIVQRAVDRVQTVEQTRATLEDARTLGFRGINVDLIYGLPHQSPEPWARTLEQVIAMRPDRAAVYSFAYLPDLRTNQRRIAAAAVPVGAAKLALFAQAYDAFVAAGYRPIGMDHFARPDDELALAQERRVLGRNFQGYTVARAGDVVALGATGISDVQGAYAQSVRPLSRYYAAIDEGRFATARGVRLSDDDRLRRDVITSLMCNFWVDLGRDGVTRFARELEDLRALEADGLVRIDGTEVAPTALGRVFVRNIAMVFDAYLRRPDGTRRFSHAV